MVSFRFTPSCCCKSVTPIETGKPCIPDCEIVYDGLINTDIYPVSNILPLIRTARLCPGENFWHGFYYWQGYANAISDVTTDYGAANSLIYVVGYSGGIRDGIDNVSFGQNLVSDISDKLKSTNNTSGFNSYFIYDNVDNKWHYSTNVTEPAWITVYSIPFNDERYGFEFIVDDDTETAWNNASPVRIILPFTVPHPYHSPEDCNFYPLVVSADFPDNHTRWEQFHSGDYDTRKYSITADSLDSYISSLTGQHHYGSDYFWVDYVGFIATGTNHTYTEDENSYVATHFSPTGCEAHTNWYRGRFYKDEPNFTPMLPTNRYTINTSEQVTDTTTGTTFTRYTTYGNPNSIPTNWDGQDNSKAYIGTYIPESRSYSYGTSMLGYPTFNFEFPLGLYKYSNKPTVLDNVSNVTRRTAPCMLRKATLVKGVNDWTEDDFRFPMWVYSSGGGNAQVNYGVPSSWKVDEYKAGEAIGFYPAYIRFDKTSTTPSELLNGDYVYGCKGCFTRSGNPTLQTRYGYGYYVDDTTGDKHYDLSATGWMASRKPGNEGEMIDTLTAGQSVGNNNTYLKSFRLGWRTIERTGQLYAGTYLLPTIPQAIIDDVLSDLWIWTGIMNNPTDKTFYFVPTIYICGYVV